jgi:hypothetical protein
MASPRDRAAKYVPVVDEAQKDVAPVSPGRKFSHHLKSKTGVPDDAASSKTSQIGHFAKDTSVPKESNESASGFRLRRPNE